MLFDYELKYNLATTRSVFCVFSIVRSSADRVDIEVGGLLWLLQECAQTMGALSPAGLDLVKP